MASRDIGQFGPRRLTTETKQAFKTTEFWVFLLLSAIVLIAADNIGGGRVHDYFRADQGWLYVVILAAAYMISRGLAKAGSREPYSDLATTSDSDGIHERFAKAAAVLRDGDVPAAEARVPHRSPDPRG